MDSKIHSKRRGTRKINGGGMEKSRHLDLYRKKLTTFDQAVSSIRENGLLIHALTTAEPPGLLNAVSRRLKSGDLKKIKVFSLLPLAHACKSLLAPELCDCVESYTAFVSPGDRGLVTVGLSQYIPNHFHQVPRLIRENMEVEDCVATVSPMDKAGYMSLGTANDFTATAARRARLLLVEVNKNMPRVFGQSSLHVSQVHAICENHVPLQEMPSARPKEEFKVIGGIIAEMVPDGATLQLGVGGLPNAVAEYLSNHKNLGIHTEVFGPGMAKLIQKGVANGLKKSLHPQKHVFTVAQGDQEMFEFMDNNPAMESYGVDYVNHPAVIAQNRDMISINSIIEVDLLGQCNSEFMDGHQFSGTGGQLDFVRGAYDAPGGKSILAFTSTAKKASVSRIVPKLKPGAMVSTPRMDTHWLVTEYGKSNLKGMCTRDRALAIVELAHPKFREGLLRAAEDMMLL
jgi:itaconate CoA-transferase